jgi:segregation and condensation protein B
MTESPTLPPEEQSEVENDRTTALAGDRAASPDVPGGDADVPVPAVAADAVAAPGPVAVPLLTPPVVTLAALCEALLFIAAAPLTAAELAKAADVPPEEIVAALGELGESLQASGRGLRLQFHDERYALTSAPTAARAVARLLGLSRTERLSAAALETLAIVAYRGPVTRGEIEAIRGVDSSGVVQTLVARELIEAVGRRTTVGQPIEYAVTAGFLRHFGLASLDELPPLGEVNGQSVEETWDERLRGVRETSPGSSASPPV